MTEIKSAFEIAMERTQDIKSNKETLVANEHKNIGKRLASEFLDPAKDDVDVMGTFKKYSVKEQRWVKQGFIEALCANISLPNDRDYGDRLATLEKGITLVIKEKRQVRHIFQQVQQFFEQYLDTQDQVGEQLKEQYASKLREKEEQLSKQMGTQVKLNPESDPEFANILSKNLSRLEQQYNEALRQVKDEIKRMFESSR